MSTTARAGAARATRGGVGAAPPPPRRTLLVLLLILIVIAALGFALMHPRGHERIRLKKYVVTDYVKKRVPVQRERLELEREPPAS